MPRGSFLRTFLHSQLFVTPPKVTHDFSGQTIIVTGANVGLGLEAARQFAELGCAKLILAVRTLSKGEAAKESIIKSSGRTEDFVEFEGMEQNIKVNVVSTFAIALLMLPKLRQTAIEHNVTPHLEIVTSEAHKVTTFPESQEDDILAKLADKEHYEKDGKSNSSRYPVAKLMQVLFVRELVKHTKGVPVITLVTPGLTHSELANRSPSKIEHIGGQIFKFLLARKTEGHGKYMEDGKLADVDIWIAPGQLDAVQKKTYEQTLAYIETLEPGISKNI